MAEVLIKTQIDTVANLVISPISKLDEIESSEFYIHNIPWQIRVKKHTVKNSLAVYFCCSEIDDNDEDSLNRTAPARITIKLIPFDGEKKAFEFDVSPRVFSPSDNFWYGEPEFIQWGDLMRDENKYVRNDTIQLEIRITVEDPNSLNKSILKCESIGKSCGRGSSATYRLTVTNVEKLMAVRSQQFIVRGLSWTLSLYKHQKSTLGIRWTYESSEDISYKIKMSIKLLSSTNGVDPIEKCVTDQLEPGEDGDLEKPDIISWDELLKPENGYVNNDSITLEVELKVNKLDDDDSAIEAKNAAKPRRLECSICLEEMDNQEVSATKCGHMFCTACITKAVTDRKACPMCNKAAQLEDLRCLYLPA